MDKNLVQIETLEGAKQIKQYCREAARHQGLRLKEKNGVSWSIDIVEDDKKYILTVEAETGSTQIAFTLEDIERYPNAEGRKAINASIDAELKEIA